MPGAGPVIDGEVVSAADGTQVKLTCESPATAVRQNLARLPRGCGEPAGAPASPSGWPTPCSTPRSGTRRRRARSSTWCRGQAGPRALALVTAPSRPGLTDVLSGPFTDVEGPDAGGLHVNSTWASPGAAARLNGRGRLSGEQAGSMARLARGRRRGHARAAAVPPATIAGPPTMVAARHVPASARSHGPRRRRRVSLGNLDSSRFRPP